LEANERVRRDGLDTNGEIPRRISSGELHSADDDFLTRLF
jgi:hypothetical protein